MTAPSVSVVVVSRHRPEALEYCLTSLSRLIYPNYEIIVVTDPSGEAAIHGMGLTGRVRVVPFDIANISIARNRGIEAAAGDIVAFIDDDAVAEPLWLLHLAAAFHDPEVSIAGGFVRGRNGISFQWKARSIDCTGMAIPLQLNETCNTVLSPPPDQAVKTEGTNMAVRRQVLLEQGGFDPAYRFYLDETDLNMRLAVAGYKTVIVPLAQVHHAYAPSTRRRRNRSVTDLYDIGASSMIFLRLHCPEALHVTRIAAVRQEQRERLLIQMRDGLLEPSEVRWALKRLEQGLTEAAEMVLPQLQPLHCTTPAFLRFESSANGDHIELAGRIWQKSELCKQAAHLAEQGKTVSVFIFSHTGLFHSVQYCKPGFWLQRGGLFGRSDRGQKLFRLDLFRTRVQAETRRTAEIRWDCTKY
ncbi:Putative glycosyltransferase EpsH [Thalassovita gelatinovora]|uniref:Putative glycosyltransferase EpsH n=1 Tax=Thalassovita gelatinovora TaxID=53501 RepID=A0A0P1FSK7_THAGE|nr:glycosyltransferase family 2 protein [Thalassovita gelatinovora]QIZ81108.1 glycosyltransferase family 2 protein [Thalassovita gelatinovora]CUH64888.1 Putative glycosyltransferase EpsH [Thalassovita gelatinovora]SEP90120.1 Glycosyltransferase, GT2 family [Thalassovita gelatinovora]